MNMTSEQKLQLLLTLDKAIWSCQWRNLGSPETSQRDFETRLQRCGVKSQFIPNGVVFAKHFKGTLAGFDLELHEAPGVVRMLRILQQNPNKTDGMFGRLTQYAILARAGHRICWVIDRARPQGNQFLGRIQDGQFIKNQPRAYQKNTAAVGAQAYTVNQALGTGGLPDLSQIPDINSQNIPAEVEAHDFSDFVAFDADDDAGPDGFDMPYIGEV